MSEDGGLLGLWLKLWKERPKFTLYRVDGEGRELLKNVRRWFEKAEEFGSALQQHQQQLQDLFTDRDKVEEYLEENDAEFNTSYMFPADAIVWFVKKELLGVGVKE